MIIPDYSAKHFPSTNKVSELGVKTIFAREISLHVVVHLLVVRVCTKCSMNVRFAELQLEFER